MSLLRRIFLCRFGLHTGTQQKAKYVESHLVSQCRHCQTAMYKDLRQNRWLAGSPPDA